MKSKKQFDIITIGSVMRDIFFYTDEGKIINNKKELLKQKLLGFELGAKIEPGSSYVGWGGGALNSAISFSRLGLKVGVIVNVDRGDKQNLANHLSKEKISLLAGGNSNKTTGVSFIVVDNKSKEHVTFLSRGANKDLKLPATLPESEWIYLSGLTGPNASANLETVRKSVVKRSTLLAWNPGNEQLQLGWKKLLPLIKVTSVLILNKDEAMELVASGFKNTPRKKLENTAFLLYQLTHADIPMVVITDGRNGASVATVNGYISEKIFKKWSLVETTGAGDAFGSTFVAGLKLNDGDVKKSLHWGLVNSGSVVSQVGATDGLLNKKVIARM
jgi:hypothetical protein